MDVDRQLADLIPELEQNQQWLDRAEGMLKRLRESLQESRKFNEIARYFLATAKSDLIELPRLRH